VQIAFELLLVNVISDYRKRLVILVVLISAMPHSNVTRNMFYDK